MMAIRVQAEHDYEVLIDVSWLEKLQELCAERIRVAVIHSTNMSSELVNLKINHPNVIFFPVPDGEDAKTMATLSSLWDQLAETGFTRSDLIIGIGGGTITDLAGFAAATWLRGVDWVAVPTTVAAMVDAAIGGKTGINSVFGKNLIGAFHSPRTVIIDTSWLQSLSSRDFSAGLAEVIKCGFIVDEQILELLEGKNLSEVQNNRDLVVELIYRAAKVKADVVGRDFKESFDREVLNYGHTLGHAIEIHSKYQLKHGEAVSIGLVFAAQLANIKGLLEKNVVDRHMTILKSMNLPISYPKDAWSDLFPLLALDKKSRGHLLRFVAISDIGKTLRIEDATQSELALAYERISS